MKVKIDNQIFDSNIQPIMIILNDEEKQLIFNMGCQTRFCSYPPGMGEEQIKYFMVLREEYYDKGN